jgi:superoxide reductase
MERRAFLSSALTGAAGLALAPHIANATDKSDLTNVIFTETDPGHWKGKEKLHVPLVEIKDGQLTVTTPHPMSEAHFIVSHSVVLENGDFLGRQTFTWKDAPISKHALPAGYKGKIIVTSTCNQHDWWVKNITI